MKPEAAAYRHEIDILRAIAVLAVVINHYFPSLLNGGFLGVDIFFVISGFLITTQIAKDLDSNTFSFVTFYKRRIKRILPALYFMLTIVSFLSVLLLLPSDLLQFIDSLKSTILYYSNFYFAGHYDYFSQNTKEFPLLHTWSLSVEEQFYFILPLLMFFNSKILSNTNYKFFLIIFLSLCSFVTAQILSFEEHSKIFSYYSLQTRFFEMSMGSCAALYALNYSSNNVTRFLQRNTAYLFFLILLYFLFFSKTVAHPSFFILPLLLSTSLLLVSPSNSSFFLKTKKLTILAWFGKISYSLYLWHWPLIALYTYAFYRPEHRHLDKLLLILISIIFSSLSYYLIENPLRHNTFNFKKSFTFYLAIPSIVLLFFAFAVQKKNGIIFERKDKYTLQDGNVFLAPQFCYNQINNSCVIGDTTKKVKTLLFGDSHAGHYIAIIDEIGKNYGFSVVGISISNCYPLFNSTTNLPAESKKDTVPLCYQAITELTKNLDNYSTVILAGRWSSLFDKDYQKLFPFEQELQQTFKHLSITGKKIIIMAQIPEFTESSFNNSVRQSLIFNTEINFMRSYSEKIGNEHMKAKMSPFSTITMFEFAENSHLNLSNLPFYKNMFIYSDWNHLKESGARRLAKDLGPIFVEKYLSFVK